MKMRKLPSTQKAQSKLIVSILLGIFLLTSVSVFLINKDVSTEQGFSEKEVNLNVSEQFVFGLNKSFLEVLNIQNERKALFESVEAKTQLEQIQDKNYIEQIRNTDSIRERNGNNKNLKSYDSQNRRLTIENENLSKILEVSLLSDYEVTGLIASPNTKVAEIFLYDYGDIDSIFDSFTFYDLNRNMTEVTKKITLKYAVDTEECYSTGISNGNGRGGGSKTDQECYNVTNWIEFNNTKELPSKNLRIGLFTSTIPGEHIEWVPNVKGFEILEWGAWEIATAVYTGKSYTQGDGSPQSIWIKSTGDYYYVSGGTNDNITEYVMSTPWDISTSSATGDYFVPGGTSVGPAMLKDDGTKLYVLQTGTNLIVQYTLSPAWDLSSASADGKTMSTSEEPNERSFTFKPDGTRLYLTGYGDDAVHEYTLSTAWDVSTATHTRQISVVADQPEVYGVFFKTDGTKMYLTGRNNGYMDEYSLSDAWNVSSAVHTWNFINSEESSNMVNFFFKSDGQFMYGISWDDNIYEFELNGTLPECDANNDCAGGEFCNSSQMCQSDLADGATCDAITYSASQSEEDGACTSGYCDSDGVGVSDDNICFTPTSTYFQNESGTLRCEYSTDLIALSQVDEYYEGWDLGVCNLVGEVYFEDQVSSTCGAVDKSIFECNDGGCSCSQPLCDGLSSGDNISVCSAGNTYFADECSSTAGGTDRGDNICRSSSFDGSCTADSECNGIEAGTGDCTASCQYATIKVLNITDPTTASPKAVSDGDNITITFNFTENGAEITSDVTLESVFIGGEQATILGGAGGTPETSQIDYEDFEGYAEGSTPNPIGNWAQYYTDTDFMWRVYTGNGESSSTGPTANYDGYYGMVETSSGYCNSPNNAILYLTPAIDFSTYDEVNVSFAYNLYGANIGTLNIKENTTGTWNTVWSLSGNQGTDWFTANQNITGLTGTGNIAIWYDCGASYTSDGAVDSVNITGTTGGGSSQEFWYTAGIGWRANVTVPSGLEGYQDLFVNATYNGETVNETESNAITYGELNYTLDITNPTTGSPVSVSSGDNISINFNFLEEASNLTSGLTLGTVLIGGQEANPLTSQSCTGTLDCSVYTNETGCNTCSQCNWTGDSINSTDKFCGNTCSGGDYTYDSTPSCTNNVLADACTGASSCDGTDSVVDIWLNGTSFKVGDSVNVIWQVMCYNTNDNEELWYYNGSSWELIFEDSTCDYNADTGNYSADFIITSSSPTQYVRAIAGYNDITSECYTDTYGDVDDLAFSVVDGGGCVAIDGGSCSSCSVGECETNCSEAGCSLGETPIFTYIAGIGWQVNVTVPTGLSGYQDLFLNATYGAIVRNETESNSVNYGASDTTPPYFTSIPSDDSITYGENWAGVDFDAEDETEFDDFYVNDTRFTINSTGFLDDVSTLAFGVYVLNITIKDTALNENSTLYTLTVNKANPNASLTTSESWSISYGTEVTIGLTEGNDGDGDVTYEIFRDGVSVGTGETWTPGSGSYTYILNTTGGANYTANASIDTQTLVVTDDTYPTFSNYWDDNATIEGSGTAHFNVTVLNTNGTVGLEIDGSNYTATYNSGGYELIYQEDPNATSCSGTWDPTDTCAKTYDGDWDTFGSSISGTTYVYQNFSIIDNEIAGSFIRWKGPQERNVTIPRDCIGGGVLQTYADIFVGGIINIHCYNYTASDWTGSIQQQTAGEDLYDMAVYWNTSINGYYNVSAPLSGEGTYPYYWWAYGSGDNKNFNVSETRDYYVNATASLCGTQVTGTTTLTEDLDCTNDGLYMNGDNSVLDCAGHTINYSSSGAESDRGIEFWGVHNNQTVKNCIIQMTNTTSTELYRQGIIYYNNRYGNIYNTTIRVYGENPAIEAWGDSQAVQENLNVSHVTIFSEWDGIGISTNSFDSIVEYSNITAEQNGIYTWSGADDLIINNNIINSTDAVDGAGIYLHGSTFGTQIYDNTIYADYQGVHSEINSTNVTNNIFQSNTGVYFLHSNDSYIIGNYITTDGAYVSNWEGAGIYSDGDNVVIRDNTIDTSGNIALGIALAGATGTTIDNATVTTSGTQSYGIYISNGANGNVVENSSVLTSGGGLAVGLYIYGDNNNVTNVNSTTTGGDDTPGYSQGSASLLIRDSDGVYIEDTILNALHSDDIQARGTLEGTAYFINVTYDEIAFHDTEFGQYLDFYWYMDVHVNDSLGNLENANVSIFDYTDSLVHTELTDAGGDITQQLLEAFIANGSVQTDYTPHTVNVTKAGYITNSTIWNITELGNVQITIMMTEQDSTPPYFTSIPADDSITYGENWAGVDFDAEDASSSIDSYWVNDSRFTINSTGFLDDVSILGAGVYPINVSVNDTEGNENSTIYTLTVNTKTPYGSVTGTSPITYGTAGDVEGTESNTGDGDVVYKLYRDGVEVSNPDTSTLGAGVYNYVYNTTGGANYSSNASIDTFELTVDQDTPAGSLQSSEGWTLTYPTETIISLSESNTGDGDVTYIIYRDGVSIGAGETITLGYGTYDYVLNTTGGTNWTSNSSMDVQTLTINKNDGACDVLFNETSPLTYPEQFQVYTNCGSDFTLYRNGTEVSNNSVHVLGAGVWNFTVVRTDQENYTNIYDEELFTINQATTSLSVTGTSPITYGTTGDVQGTGCPSGATCNLYRDGIEVSNPDAVVLGAGVYNYVYNTTGNENYTADSDSFELTVNKASPTIELYLDGGHADEQIDITETAFIEGQLDIGQLGLINLTIDGEEVNSSTTLYNITYTFDPIGLGLGVYVVGFNYSGNQNYTSAYVSYNITVVHPGVPSVTVIFPVTVAYYSSDELDLNYSASDPIPDSCWYSNGTGNSTAVPFGQNFTGVVTVEGENTWTVYCNDTVGNIGEDSHSFYVDRTPPYFISIEDQIINETSSLSYTPTADDAGVGFDSWGINATEIITINPSTGEITNTSILIPGYYSYNITINDTLGNTNSTIWNLNVTSVDSVNPSVSGLTESPVDGSEYSPGQVYEFNATITDDNLDTVLIEFDGVNYSVSGIGDVYNFTITDLAVGSYSYTWFANDSYGNVNNTESGTYDVIQNSSYVLSIDITPSDTEDYGTETTADGLGCPSGVTCNLFLNGSSVSDPDVATLGAGVWNYTYNTTGNSNYSGSSVSSLLTINPISSQTNLTFDKTSPQDYGTEIIPYCSVITGEGSAVLTLDGEIITSGVGITLGANTYTFNCSLAQTANYSYSENVSDFTIDPIASEVFTYLNNSRENITIYAGQSIWLNGTLNTGEGDIYLYNNGSLINSGSSPLSNLTTFSTVGLYNVTTMYIQTQNYTSSYETFWVNVTEAPDTTSPYFTGIPANDSISYGEDWAGVDFDAEDAVEFDSFFIDDTTNFTINSTGYLDNNTFLLVGTYLINVSINDTSGNINSTIYELVVTKATPTGSLVSNATWVIAPGDSVNISFTESNEGDSDVNYTVYRDGVYIGTGEVWSPAPGTYTYVLNNTGGQNYSANANIDTQTLTVTSAGIPLIEFTNDTEGNNSFVARDWIFVNVSVSTVAEDTITFNLYNSSHDIINSSAFTDSTRTINWTNLTDGQYYYNVTVNNTGGGENSTQTRLITLDNEYGNLSIIIPVEGSAYGNVVTSVNVDVNYSIDNETNLDSCWYRLRGVQTIDNTSTPCAEGYNNFTITISNFGYLTLDVYSNDSASNEEYDYVNFYVNKYTGPQQGGGSNYDPSDNDEEDLNNYNVSLLCAEVNDFLEEYTNYTYDEKEDFRNRLAILFGFAIDDQLLNKYLIDFETYCPEYADNETIPEQPTTPGSGGKKVNYWTFAICILSILILILILIIWYHRERLVLILNRLRDEDDEKEHKKH